MKEDIVLYLPWPPTINDYYKVTLAGQRYLDKKVRGFRADVEKALHEQCPGLKLADRLFVEVFQFPPDRRKRDLDNYIKGFQDACTKGGLWIDDSLIDQLFIYRGEVVKGGAFRVEISEAGPLVKFT